MEKSTIDIFIEKGIPYCYESCECNSCKRNDITGGKERKHERNHEVYQPDSSDWRSGLQQQIERLWNRPLSASLYHSDLQGAGNRTGKNFPGNLCQQKQCDPTACDTGRKRLDYPSAGYGRPQSLASIPHRENAGTASLCAERYAGMERVPAGRAE